jgi:hypothetical protein
MWLWREWKFPLVASIILVNSSETEEEGGGVGHLEEKGNYATSHQRVSESDQNMVRLLG